MKKFKKLSCLLVLSAFAWPLSADILYYPSEYRKLQNDIYALSVQKSLLETQLANEKRDAAFLKNRFEEKIRNLESRIAGLEDKLRETQNALRDERRAHVEDNAHNSLKLDEKDRQIKGLRREGTQTQQKMAAEAAEQEKKYLAELERLKAELEKSREEFRQQITDLADQKNKRIAELEAMLTEKSRALAQCLDTAQQQKNVLSELEQQAKELEHRLQKEIAEGNLRIKRYKDRIVINIDDKILFASGSAYLRRDVRKTLDTVADVLKRNPGPRVLVEGHTDNVPIKTPRFPDNWELSSARALSVLRHLLETKGLDPVRFGAAGYGEFRPVAENTNAENRQLNRRVDIVLLGGSLPELAK